MSSFDPLQQVAKKKALEAGRGTGHIPDRYWYNHCRLTKVGADSLLWEASMAISFEAPIQAAARDLNPL